MTSFRDQVEREVSQAYPGLHIKVISIGHEIDPVILYEVYFDLYHTKRYTKEQMQRSQIRKGALV